MIVLHFTGRSSASIVHCPHPLEHPDLLRKSKMKPPGNSSKQQTSKSLQEITTTTQKPPGITGNHQKASSKKDFVLATQILWDSMSFFGRLLLGMVYRCLVTNSCYYARTVRAVRPRCNNSLMVANILLYLRCTLCINSAFGPSTRSKRRVT